MGVLWGIPAFSVFQGPAPDFENARVGSKLNFLMAPASRKGLFKIETLNPKN